MFHPAVSMYFAKTFGEPTAAQAKGWPSIQAGKHTLIAAPTGSGKTLAGFLSAIDTLVREADSGPLPDETRVVYVSPLKALSNDIEKNLQLPLAGIAQHVNHGIRVGLRTGDTPASERTKIAKKPPHLFVTTPESLYILLTSKSGRKMLETVRTVIVDEIHATIGSKRGSHLALSLERLDALAKRRVQRIGLSATQKPIDLVARFLVGDHDASECTIVDEGHARTIDLAIEMPRSPLEPVMATEVWEEVHARLAELVKSHKTTLVFVNTRRMAERLSAELADLVGKDQVLAHHGSLSREIRLDAEQRLKSGQLKALVATASLELGIDIGDVDLVCQIGSPRAIATLLQRVGRSGHFLGGIPKGRLFPSSRDDLVECLALLEAAKNRELDKVCMPEAPLDVLAQQITAASALEEWKADDLYALVTRAFPYRGLSRHDFDEVVKMLGHGFSTRRGRRSAHVHYDAVNGMIRGRKGAALTAVTNGGAIPENTEYAVVQQPEGVRVGSIHEDFAIESMAGDIFQLGTTSWRILRVLPGVVQVEDARGEPPTIPFWLGEAPGRTRELSSAVMRVMERAGTAENLDAAVKDVAASTGAGDEAALQASEYLVGSKIALGELPSENVVVAERFFDEAGNTHLVIHTRFGAKINRAWGLALRKTFCRSFNFELQAAATDDALVLSLGPTHSFPLEEAFAMLKSKACEKTLVQAVLDAPVFGIRWRWAATIALAIPRWRGGKKTPPPLQRMLAEDLLTVCFPDAQACLENVVGDREVPDHPLVRQALRDCIEDAMDARGLMEVLSRIESGEIRTVARDLTQPSPLAAEILGARPYAFLDDAPLEERRTQAVMSRRFTDVTQMGDLAALDGSAIARVRDEAWPEPENRDEAHDALSVLGFLTDAEARGEGHVARNDLRPFLAELEKENRTVHLVDRGIWVAAERKHEFEDLANGMKEILRSRLEGLGPVTVTMLAASFGAPIDDVALALTALEVEGFAMRGKYSPGTVLEEWCDRRLLARIHRATLERLRREIEPVSTADLMRFFIAWQRATIRTRARGPQALEVVLAQLEGFEAPASAWESDILPLRVQGYEPAWLDSLCISGRIAWMRGAGGSAIARSPVRATGITLMAREHIGAWDRIRPRAHDIADLSESARAVHEVFVKRGAVFAQDLVLATKLSHDEVIDGIGELVARGVVSSDSFAGLRALVAPRTSLAKLGGSGRWALVSGTASDADVSHEEALESVARTLLRRWGVVFRRVLDRETGLPPWRDLVRVFRRLEARGEIRGGRFVTLHAGEQFALPEAIGLMRELRRQERRGDVVTVSAVDPLALAGIVTPGSRTHSIVKNKVSFRDGMPIEESGSSIEDVA